MKYYILTQKEERGCPRGKLNAVLYDTFYEKSEKIEYGYFPWYASQYPWKGEYQPFPLGLCLISKDRLYDFGIRRITNVFCVVSADFLEICQSLKVDMQDYAPIEVCSRKRKPITEKKYYAAVFKYKDVLEVADEGSSFIKDEYGHIVRIRSLKIRPDFTEHLFRFRGMVGSSNTFICSEDFYHMAMEKDMKGVGFVPLADAVWPSVFPI